MWRAVVVSKIIPVWAAPGLCAWQSSMDQEGGGGEELPPHLSNMPMVWLPSPAVDPNSYSQVKVIKFMSLFLLLTAHFLSFPEASMAVQFVTCNDTVKTEIYILIGTGR